MQRILKGISHFQEHVYPRNRELFQRLAQGQSPEALVIGCSDSRLALDLITQSGPGDMFVCRNAGNIVPPYDRAEAVSATIEYAVRVLKIKHIVVCGHSDCGAMKALLNPESLSGLSTVSQWLRHAEGARHALDELPPAASQKEATDAVTRLNVRLQLENLRTHPHVFAQIQTGNLKLHGWVFDIASGEISAWDAEKARWSPIQDSEAKLFHELQAVA
jgi:carbonic anhydrase